MSVWYSLLQPNERYNVHLYLLYINNKLVLSLCCLTVLICYNSIDKWQQYAVLNVLLADKYRTTLKLEHRHSGSDKSHQQARRLRDLRSIGKGAAVGSTTALFLHQRAKMSMLQLSTWTGSSAASEHPPLRAVNVHKYLKKLYTVKDRLKCAKLVTCSIMYSSIYL
eukprot:3684-Heterococcus_DN1.PRE.5